MPDSSRQRRLARRKTKAAASDTELWQEMAALRQEMANLSAVMSNRAGEDGR